MNNLVVVLSFQESEGYSHHLISQRCDYNAFFFFRTLRRQNALMKCIFSILLSKTYCVTTFPSGRMTGSISLVGVCYKPLAS